MNDPLKHGLRPVPFRRLVRTSGSEAPVARSPAEDEYGYGCVEWYQYPGQRNRQGRLADTRRRSSGR